MTDKKKLENWMIRAVSWPNQQNGICAQRRLTSDWADLIRVFAVCFKKAWILSYPLSAQRRLWSDWADAQADLSLCWARMPFCWFCHNAAQLWLEAIQWVAYRVQESWLLISTSFVWAPTVILAHICQPVNIFDQQITIGQYLKHWISACSVYSPKL